MEIVEKELDRHPELALMGSCVLVMLMKDQDVYVMNLGDSRAILAHDNDQYNSSSFSKGDLRHRNRSRESLVRVELDRISEESPMHNPNRHLNSNTKAKELSICRLKMRAVQLSTDHSTSIEEVIILLNKCYSCFHFLMASAIMYIFDFEFFIYQSCRFNSSFDQFSLFP